ncbi:MAG: hypothetical protein JWN75_1281 [Candidatus Saccharibacteria bacterium]|nr:hypothetical protein [Candidatus Saccharibacteria bacterium]MDB5181786.1 hypothetical protein [Candidatus Saccharibacteria bacterium]
MTTVDGFNSPYGNTPDSYLVPEEMGVDAFAEIHGAYIDAAKTEGLSVQDKTTLAEDLNRLCISNPVSYEQFMARQARERESQANLLSSAAMHDVQYFVHGDSIGTKG